MADTKTIETMLKLSIDDKIRLYEILQKEEDKRFEDMLKELNMTEEEWNQMHDKMHEHFAAKYKEEADAIRARRIKQ